MSKDQSDTTSRTQSVTPRRYKLRGSRSVGSPSRTKTPPRRSSVLEQFKQSNKESFAISPMDSRMSVLTDNTYIEEPNRKSWWKLLDDNSRDMTEVLQNNMIIKGSDNELPEFIDVEILSQEKKNFSVNIPESSGSESIESIVIPQRKLFTNKDIPTNKKFGNIIKNRETMAKTTTEDVEEIQVQPKNLLNQVTRVKSKPVFPAALLDITTKNIMDKTKKMPPQKIEGQMKKLFGYRTANNKKNIFANFVASESEDEISDIQPKIFGFNKRPLIHSDRKTTVSRVTREPSPASSLTTDIEMDDWRMLPSSTMVENQLEEMMTGTPNKKARSSLPQLIECDEPSSSNATSLKNKTIESNKSTTARNKSQKSIVEKEIESLDKHTTVLSNKSQVKCDSDQSSKTLVDNKTKEINKSFVNVTTKINNSTTAQHKSQVKSSLSEGTSKENASLETIRENIDKSIKDNSKTTQSNVAKNFEVKKSTLSEPVEVLSSQETKEHQDLVQNDNDEDFVSLQYEFDENDEMAASEELSSEQRTNSNNSILKINQKSEQHVTELMERQGNTSIVKNVDIIIDKDCEGKKTNKQLQGKKNNKTQNKSEVEKDEPNSENEIQKLNLGDDQNQNEKYVEESEEDVSQESDKEEPSLQEIEEEQESEELNYEESVEEQLEESEELNYEESVEENPEQSDTNGSVENRIDKSELQKKNQSNDSQQSEEIEVENDEMDYEESVEENPEESDINRSVENRTSISELQNENQNNDKQQSEEIKEDKDEIQYDSKIYDNSSRSKDNEDTEMSDENINGIHATKETFNEGTEIQSGTGINELDDEPEAVLHDVTNQHESFIAQGRNTSVRIATGNISQIEPNIRPSFAPIRESTGLHSDGQNSTAEGSGWDSHRTTRKTLRQTFGKDFTPRKSLRAMVMEKSAKRKTFISDANADLNVPQANSTEIQYMSRHNDENHYMSSDEIEESPHEVSQRTRQTNLEMYLQKLKTDTIERRLKTEEAVKNSLNAAQKTSDIFKVPLKRAIRRSAVKPVQTKKSKPCKPFFPLISVPQEVIDDMAYKPPKRFRPANAPWITNRLYKFLESKLEPKYDYKARVRAEKLVQKIYNFTKDNKRHEVATPESVEELKQEMARLNVVRTHHNFYTFFQEFMPRDIRVKVNPDIVNNIPMPRNGVFADILRENT